MSTQCLSNETAFIPCIHPDGAKCLLAYCGGCGKDLYRECERECAYCESGIAEIHNHEREGK